MFYEHCVIIRSKPVMDTEYTIRNLCGIMWNLFVIRNSEKRLLSKIQSLKYGANIEKELIHMREKAYQTSLLERAKRDTKPNWSVYHVTIT